MKVALLLALGLLGFAALFWPAAGSKDVRGNRASIDSAGDSA